MATFETLEKSRRLGEPPRPKILERMPSEPRFEIDEDKLRSALPPPVSSTGADLKYSLAFIGLAVGVIALLLLVGWLLLRALA